MKGTITHDEDESVFKNRLLELKIYDDTVHFFAGEWRFGSKMHLEDLKKFIAEYEKRKQNDLCGVDTIQEINRIIQQGTNGTICGECI